MKRAVLCNLVPRHSASGTAAIGEATERVHTREQEAPGMGLAQEAELTTAGAGKSGQVVCGGFSLGSPKALALIDQGK